MNDEQVGDEFCLIAFLKFMLAVARQYFNAVEGANYEPTEHLLMTACVLTVVPALVAFFVTQKYFVRGIVMSGVKG